MTPAALVDASVGPMRSHLIDAAGDVVDGVTRADVEARLAAGHLFWLDIPGVGSEEETWLRTLFGLHPLAVEDALDFDERPKLEDYPDYSVLVLYGAAADEATAASCAEFVRTHAEVHCFISDTWLVTVHHTHCPALHDLAMRIRARKVPISNPSRLLHHVADSLVDSFFPLLSALDERIDDLQQQIVTRTSDAQLRELLDLRSALNSLRKIVAPQRDLFASLGSGVASLPGADDEAVRYYRDVYDHLIRLADMIDSYRDLLSGSTDAYLSVQSNEMNSVMKQLTTIATVFLPMSFLTGFFGQNFGWMINHIGTRWEFLAVGCGSQVLTVVALVLFFRQRGWVGR